MHKPAQAANAAGALILSCVSFLAFSLFVLFDSCLFFLPVCDSFMTPICQDRNPRCRTDCSCMLSLSPCRFFHFFPAHRLRQPAPTSAAHGPAGAALPVCGPAQENAQASFFRCIRKKTRYAARIFTQPQAPAVLTKAACRHLPAL